jgi:hypothetical protein
VKASAQRHSRIARFQRAPKPPGWRRYELYRNRTARLPLPLVAAFLRKASLRVQRAPKPPGWRRYERVARFQRAPKPPGWRRYEPYRPLPAGSEAARMAAVRAVSPGCHSLWSLLSCGKPRFASSGPRSRQDGGGTSCSAEAYRLLLERSVYVLKEVPVISPLPNSTPSSI